MANASVAILEAAADAHAVVVGSRGHRPLRGALLGSTALQVVTHAPCPTIVVRDSGTRAVSSPGRIVVGTDGSDTSRNALAYAFAQAEARGCELVIVHAWLLDLSGGRLIEVVAATAEKVEEAQHALLDQQVADFTSRYPDVITHQVVARDEPAALLTRLAMAGDPLDVVLFDARGDRDVHRHLARHEPTAPAARTRTSTSSVFGDGLGASSKRSDSGPP